MTGMITRNIFVGDRTKLEYIILNSIHSKHSLISPKIS